MREAVRPGKNDPTFSVREQSLLQEIIVCVYDKTIDYYEWYAKIPQEVSNKLNLQPEVDLVLDD